MNGATRRATWLILLGDLVVILAAFGLALILRFLGDVPKYNLDAITRTMPWLIAASLGLYQVYGLYDLRYRHWVQLLPGLISAHALSLLVAVSASFFLGSFAFPRSVFLLGGALHVTLAYGWRRWVDRKGWGREPQRLLLVTTAAELPRLEERLRWLPPTYRIAGAVVDDRFGLASRTDPSSIPVLGKVDDLPGILRTEAVDAILMDANLDVDRKRNCIREALLQGKRVLIVPTFYDVLVSTATVADFENTLLLEVSPPSRSEGWKRLIDLALAAVGLVVLSPVMLLVAALVAVESPGPVLYKQARVGAGDRVFTLYKFRTMQHGAEDDTGPVLASEHDSRVTRVGRFLRKTRLDEVPQLFNVLRGDMSLVGPRPERPQFVAQFSQTVPEYRLRLNVQAGLTGLAQVAGSYSADVQDKLRFDLYYSQTRSPWADLRILFHTLRAVLTRGKGQ